MNTIFPGHNQWVQPGYSIVGTCSICGGAVTVPTVWSSVVPPVPSCTACGAVKKQSYGPVVDMVPRAGNIQYSSIDNPKFTKDN